MGTVLGRSTSDRAAMPEATVRRRPLRDVLSVSVVAAVAALLTAALVGPASTKLQPILDPARPAAEASAAVGADPPVAVDIRPRAARPRASVAAAPPASAVGLAGQLLLTDARAPRSDRPRGRNALGPSVPVAPEGAETPIATPSTEGVVAVPATLTAASSAPVSRLPGRASARAIARTIEVAKVTVADTGAAATMVAASSSDSGTRAVEEHPRRRGQEKRAK